MSDDWSLKDKVVVKNDDKGHWSMFHWRDIDTLRLKLIQDFEEKGKPFNIEEYQPFLSLNDVRTIIKRRFGENK